MFNKQEVIQEIKKGTDLVVTAMKKMESDAPEFNTVEALAETTIELANAVFDTNSALTALYALEDQALINEIRDAVFEGLGDDLEYVQAGILLVNAIQQEMTNNG